MAETFFIQSRTLYLFDWFFCFFLLASPLSENSTKQRVEKIQRLKISFFSCLLNVEGEPLQYGWTFILTENFFLSSFTVIGGEREQNFSFDKLSFFN